MLEGVRVRAEQARKREAELAAVKEEAARWPRSRGVNSSSEPWFPNSCSRVLMTSKRQDELRMVHRFEGMINAVFTELDQSGLTSDHFTTLDRYQTLATT